MATVASRRSRWGVLPFAAATALAAGVGAPAAKRGRGLWYRLLRKPRFQPPGWLFGPVWTVLYGLMSWSAYRIWRLPPSRDRTRALALWTAQIGLNGAWTPLFFGKHRIRAALVDLVALTGVVVAYIKVASRLDRRAAALFVPYLAWLGFAGLLNGSIARRNRLSA